MRKLIALMMVLGLGLSTMVTIGCEKKGPAQKTGEAIDEAASDTGRAIEDAAD